MPATSGNNRAFLFSYPAMVTFHSVISLLISRFKRACAPRFDDDIKRYDVMRLRPVNGVCFVNRHACEGISINISSIKDAIKLSLIEMIKASIARGYGI